MKSLKPIILLQLVVMLAGCSRDIVVDLTLEDEDFSQRLEAYFDGSGSASALFSNNSPSDPALAQLAYIKKILSQSELKESFMVNEPDVHLIHRSAPVETSLFYHKKRFYELPDEPDGLVLILTKDGGSFSLVYKRNKDGRLYLRDLKPLDLPKKGDVPTKSCFQYSFDGLDHEILASGAEILIAEIALKCSVFGVPYEEHHGIFYSSGIIWTAAGGKILEAEITFKTDLDGIEVKVLSGEETREVIAEAESKSPAVKGDSITFKF